MLVPVYRHPKGQECVYTRLCVMYRERTISNSLRPNSTALGLHYENGKLQGDVVMIRNCQDMTNLDY
jgi:hypothetical protein